MLIYLKTSTNYAWLAREKEPREFCNSKFFEWEDVAQGTKRPKSGRGPSKHQIGLIYRQLRRPPQYRKPTFPEPLIPSPPPVLS
jgi:hypothetical protein